MENSSPLNNPGAGAFQKLEQVAEITTTTTTRVRAEICAGPDSEKLDHRHESPEALIRHLEVFIGHRNAEQLIDRSGQENVIHALKELAYELDNDGDIRRPAAFLTWRTRQLAKGARPINVPEKKEQVKDPRTQRRIAELREQGLREGG